MAEALAHRAKPPRKLPIAFLTKSVSLSTNSPSICWARTIALVPKEKSSPTGSWPKIPLPRPC